MPRLRGRGLCSLDLAPPAAVHGPAPGPGTVLSGLGGGAPESKQGNLTPRRARTPQLESPGTKKCCPGSCSFPTINSREFRSGIWGRDSLPQSQLRGPPLREMSFTPQTVPAALSRSSYQEVVPSGHKAASPGPIALRSAPNEAGQRQERVVPIGAFESPGLRPGKRVPKPRPSRGRYSNLEGSARSWRRRWCFALSVKE